MRSSSRSGWRTGEARWIAGRERSHVFRDDTTGQASSAGAGLVSVGFGAMRLTLRVLAGFDLGIPFFLHLFFWACPLASTLSFSRHVSLKGQILIFFLLPPSETSLGEGGPRIASIRSTMRGGYALVSDTVPGGQMQTERAIYRKKVVGRLRATKAGWLRSL